MLVVNGVRAGGGPCRYSGGAGALAIDRAKDAAFALALGFNAGEATVVAGEGIANVYGIPAGTPRGWVLPVKGGAIKSWRRSDIAVDGAAAGEMGYPVAGAATVTIDCSAIGGLIVGATGPAEILVDGVAAIVASLNSGGAATVAVDGDAVLGAIATMGGEGAIAVDGVAEIMGLGYMTGSTLETEALTPSAIAAAVWNALLASHQGAGSAGKALSTASAGGVDLGALASAVVAALEATAIPVNVKQVNDTQLIGTGVTGDEWGPA